MEMLCSRCRQTVEPGACYCPTCGLPQLVYNPEPALGSEEPTLWNDAVRDAGSIAWRPALLCSLKLAVPAGILSALLAPAGMLGLMVMGVAGLWAVSLYTRSQQPPWITIGAGARVGFVTGLVGCWTSMATAAVALFAMRFWMHQGAIFDNFWQSVVGDQLTQQWSGMGMDAQAIAQGKSWLLSPEGRAAWVLCAMGCFAVLLLMFAVAGGALGARFQARSRRKMV
jgi:hypothetical protein